MKRTDMDSSLRTAVNFITISAAIAALVPATSAQVANLDSAPQNVFENESEESLAKYLSLGPISVRPHMNISAYYDDNLTLKKEGSAPAPSRDDNELEDFVWRISPGALFGAGEFRDKGNYVTLDYTPTASFYTKYNEYSSLDHLVDFNVGWKTSKLTLGVGQAYEIANGKQIESSAFVEQETFTTKLSSMYEFSEKTSAELNGRQMLIDSTERVIKGSDNRLNSINQWEIEGWGNYRQSEKLTLGAGAIFGWRDIVGHTSPSVQDVVDTPNQTFQQVAVRSAYEVSEKLDVSGSVGLFFSQFQGGDDKGPTLVFNLAGSWQPLENTYVSAEAYRRDFPSYSSSGQTYTATGLRASVRQRLFDKYSASVATGYENSDYSDTGDTNNPDRTDNYYWIRPSFDCEFSERCNAGVFYQFRTKNSDGSTRDYSNNQLGVYTNYKF